MGRVAVCLNNVLEQDHRFVKKRIAARLWFRSVDGALRTIAGYEAMNMIRKGQVRWLAKGDVVGQSDLWNACSASRPDSGVNNPQVLRRHHCLRQNPK